MRPIHRSLAGLALAVLSLPVFVSLLACLPVPIGDPERSTVDPEVSGIWLHLVEDDTPFVTLVEPYDKRTWLVTMYSLDDSGDGCADEEEVFPGDEEPVRDYSYWVTLFEASADTCLEPGEFLLFKAWRTRLGGKWLMTWEGKGGLNDDNGFDIEYWWVLGLDKRGPDRIDLPIVNFEHDAIEAVFETDKLAWLDDEDPPYDPRRLRSARRAVEKTIRRHIDDEDLFEEFWVLERIRPEHYDLFLDPLDGFLIEHEDW